MLKGLLFGSGLAYLCFLYLPIIYSEETSKGRNDFDFSIEYGYQTKAIRCFILHEVAFSLVYGHKDGAKPTSFDL